LLPSLAQLTAHPLHQLGNPANILKRRTRIAELQAEIDERRAELERYSHHHWQEFVHLIEIYSDWLFR
jgi:superfamily II RNA helicase